MHYEKGVQRDIDILVDSFGTIQKHLIFLPLLQRLRKAFLSPGKGLPSFTMSVAIYSQGLALLLTEQKLPSFKTCLPYRRMKVVLLQVEPAF